MPTTNSSSLTGHPAEHIFDFANLSLTNFLGSHVSVGYRTNTSLKQIKAFPIHCLPGFPDLFSRSLTPSSQTFHIPSPLDSCSVLPLPYLCFLLYQTHISLSSSQGFPLERLPIVSTALSSYFLPASLWTQHIPLIKTLDILYIPPPELNVSWELASFHAYIPVLSTLVSQWVLMELKYKPFLSQTSGFHSNVAFSRWQT